MNLSADLLKKLGRKYEPLTLVDFRYRNKDVAVQTDEEGNAIRMFIGKRNEEGMIKGDRYARKMIKDKNGAVIKDHWDRKGYAT